MDFAPSEYRELTLKTSLVQGEWAFGIYGSNSNTFVARLAKIGGEFDESIPFKAGDNGNWDLVVTRALNPLGHSEEYDAELSLEGNNRMATLTVCKRNFVFNFMEMKVYEEEHYRIQDLRKEMLRAVSPSGEKEVYLTHYASGGDIVIGDLVVLHKLSGDIVPISVNQYGYEAIFRGEDAVLIRSYPLLRLIDAHTGEELPGAPRFDWPEDERGRLPYIVVGAAHDTEASLTLIAYREQEPQAPEKSPVYLAVFNMDGVMIADIKTNFATRHVVKNFFIETKIELMGDYTAKLIELGNEDNTATVRYK